MPRSVVIMLERTRHLVVIPLLGGLRAIDLDVHVRETDGFVDSRGASTQSMSRPSPSVSRSALSVGRRNRQGVPAVTDPENQMRSKCRLDLAIVVAEGEQVAASQERSAAGERGEDRHRAISGAAYIDRRP